VCSSDLVQAEKAQNLVIHSEIDAFVMDRLKSQPKTLEEIDAVVVEKPKDGKHQLSLPEELDPYLPKYAFCWMFKRKQSLDQACDLYHWSFTNRTYFPEMPDYLFSARGVMERGDVVLMFRPKRIDDEMRKQPGIESLERIKARTEAHKGDPRFYVPEAEFEKQPDGSIKKVPVVGV
jgi:hypothetical protein